MGAASGVVVAVASSLAAVEPWDAADPDGFVCCVGRLSVRSTRASSDWTCNLCVPVNFPNDRPKVVAGDFCDPQCPGLCVMNHSNIKNKQNKLQGKTSNHFGIVRRELVENAIVPRTDDRLGSDDAYRLVSEFRSRQWLVLMLRSPRCAVHVVVQ